MEFYRRVEDKELGVFIDLNLREKTNHILAATQKLLMDASNALGREFEAVKTGDKGRLVKTQPDLPEKEG